MVLCMRKIVNDKKRDHADAGEAWIVAQEDIVASILGLSMVESQKIKEKKKNAISASE